MPARMAETQNLSTLHTFCCCYKMYLWIMWPSFLKPGKTFMTMLTNRLSKSDPTQLPRLVIKRQELCLICSWKAVSVLWGRLDSYLERTHIGVPAGSLCSGPTWQAASTASLGVNGALDDFRAQLLSHPQPSGFSSWSHSFHGAETSHLHCIF